MNEVEKIIANRRSIRKYSNKEINDEDIKKILKAAMQAPGSRMGSEPWEFIVVKNKETIKNLSEIDKNTELLAGANVAIVLVANINRAHYKHLWQQDMSAAATTLLLEAANLDLGAVWLGIAPNEERMNKIRNIFKLSEEYKPFNIISIGYPAEGLENKFVDKFDESRIFFENI